MLTVTCTLWEAPPAVAVKVITCDPDGAVPTVPELPQPEIKDPAATPQTMSISINATRCIQPLRLRDPKARPSRPRGANIANIMPLCDLSIEAVVVATEIVPVTVVDVVPFNVIEEGITAHAT